MGDSSIVRATPGRTSSFTSAAIAGATATVAYTVVMELDIAATGVNSNDILLLGTLVTRQPRTARIIGSVAHAANGVTLGVIYGTVARQHLPGPPWVRGLLFANLENGALYTLGPLEQHHPGITSGEVAPYWSKTAFLQSLFRHTVYGAVLGWLDTRLLGNRA